MLAISIAVGILLASALSIVIMFKLLNNEKVVKWYVKWFLNYMKKFEDLGEELEEELGL
jgi:hypothetical protein